MESEPAPDLKWHVIPGELLLESLRRVEAGEKADLVFAELWANAIPDDPEADDREEE
jgi:hypothetical protein